MPENVNYQDGSKWTSLIWAAWFGHERISNSLIEKEADLDLETDSGDTALIKSAFRLESTYSLWIFSCYLSHSLTPRGFDRIATALIDAGANIDHQDSGGRTALIDAAKYQHPWIGKLSFVLLFWTCPHCFDRSTPFSSRSIDQPTVVLSLDWIIQTIRPYSVHSLLEKGCKINTRDNTRQNALMYVAMNGNAKIAISLFDKGIELNAQNFDGDTALIMATVRNYSNITRPIIESGRAYVNIQNENGESALIWCAARNYVDIAASLIDRCADVNLKNRDGITALDIAIRENHQAVVEAINKGPSEKSLCWQS